MSSEGSLRIKLKRKAKVVVNNYSRNTRRTRNGDEGEFEGDNQNGGSEGESKKRVRFKGGQEGGGSGGRGFGGGGGGERGKFKTLDSFGRNKRVYARDNMEGTVENRRFRNGEEGGGSGRGFDGGERGKFRTLDSFERKKRVYGKDKDEGMVESARFRNGEEGGGSGRGFRGGERGKFRTSDSFGRNKRVYAKDMEEGMVENLRFRNGEERGSGRGFGGGERGKFRTLDSFERKKRVYAKDDKEGMVENQRFRNAEGVTKRKPLLKRGESRVKDEVAELQTKLRAFLKEGEKKTVVGKTDQRTMWVRGTSKVGAYEAKHSSREMRDKKENVVLAINKQDGNGSGLVKKIRENKSEFVKGKSETVVYPSISGKKKSRDKVRLDDDVEMLDDKPKWKKKKNMIKLDPHDISNKRLDDGIGIDGSKEEKKKESETERPMSWNAQFRAIQPSPEILSFVENNLLGRRRTIDLKRAGYNIDLPAPLDNVPFSSSSDRERIEETAFRNKLEFFAAAKVSSSFPPPNLPEIAFAGRSNVGKSSLLNALTRQWGVVRTSDKPGLTQTINFFELEKKLCLVDLPGYGFAYAKEEVKESWEELVKEYVSTRVGLGRVCLLIDTKWGMKARDYELVELMERSKTKYQIVLTKTDTVFPIDVARRAMQIEESLLQNKSVVQPLMMVSSKSGAGIRSLRTVLANIARFVKI